MMEALIWGGVLSTVVVAYIVWVVRQTKRGRLNFGGRPLDVQRRPQPVQPAADTAAGCFTGLITMLLVLAVLLVGLFALIWIIKRMWEIA